MIKYDKWNSILFDKKLIDPMRDAERYVLHGKGKQETVDMLMTTHNISYFKAATIFDIRKRFYDNWKL